MTSEVLKYLLALTITSSMAIISALLMRRAVRRAFGASASYALWLLVPIALVAALLPDAGGLSVARQAALSIAPVSALRIAVNQSFSSALGASPAADWPAWVLGAWAAGTALSGAYLIHLQRTFMRNLGTLSESLGVLWTQSPAGCPALLGVLRPTVILPADFKTRYTPKERVLIMAHERVHLSRGDCLWNCLVAVLRCLFWFNPLVHFAAHTFRKDQELACDAAVIQRYPNSRRSYANAMLKTQLADMTLPAGCHWGSMHPLKERLEMLKHAGAGPVNRALGRLFVAVASVAVGYCAWAAELPAVPAEAANPPSSSNAPGPGWLESGLSPATPIKVDSRSVTSGPEGEVRFEDVQMHVGTLQITADHGYARPRPTGGLSGEWTFSGNVVVQRGDQSYRMHKVILRWSKEGVWLEPTGLKPKS